MLHLVDCSLVTPPQAGPDGRARFAMLETLRAFGLDRLTEVDEHTAAARALTRFALQVAEQAADGLHSSTGEATAAQWLDAEDGAVHQALVGGADRGSSYRATPSGGAGPLVGAARAFGRGT